MKKQLVLVTALLLGSLGNSVYADESKGLNPAEAEQINIINKLIDMGDARNDSILLLAAAHLQKNMRNNAAVSTTKNRDTTAVLARAKKASQGRKDLIGIADDIAAAKTKGYDRYHKFANERY